MKRVLKYWPEILIFVILFAIFVVDVAPDLTFFNMGVDGTAYVMSAKYLYPAHKTSAPLYLLTGHLFTMIPIGSDYWRLALMSAVFAIGGVIFTYHIAMHVLAGNKKRRLYSLLASLIYGGSMMLISQAVIAETYTMVTFFSLAAFYFVLKKQWVSVAIMLGLGLATHHLVLITWLVLLIFYKEMRNWKRILITATFVLFYIYIPLSKMFSDQPNMWLNTSVSGFLSENFFTLVALVGGVAMWDFPKRLFEMLGFWGVCFTVGLIPFAWFVWKQKYWKQPLFWLFLLPWVYATTDGDPHVSRYALAGVAFGAIIIALAVSTLNIRWLWAVGVASLIMLGFNANYFDFGRTIDPTLTAAKFYSEEYPKMKDGQIFINMLPGGEWGMTFYYNKKEDKYIIPVCMGMLPNPAYLDQLEAQGVKLTKNDLEDRTAQEVKIAESIVLLNDNVLVTKPTNLYDYGATLVPAATNMNEISQWGTFTAKPVWKFIPSNPYDIITGKLELTEWKAVLKSNWSFAFFLGWGSLGLIINWFMFVLPNRKARQAVE